MSNAENVTWEDHWLTSSERKALRAVEASQKPRQTATIAEAVDLTLRRQRAQREARRERIILTGYVLIGIAVPFIVGAFLQVIAR